MYLDNKIITETYKLVDMILQSEEIRDYLRYKEAIEQDLQVNELKKKLAKAKERYEEYSRYGEYHPDYHEAKKKVYQILAEINQNRLVQKFKQAEQELDELLYLVAKTLAQAISPSIIVSKNAPFFKNEGMSCTTGGCQSCSLQRSCAIKVS
ncbi:YlbF family regulator [Tepidibacillus sp. LV47]|uniref:YlbF family regulator n=1 Tax=Tepidibacillus sp. LV47 TaxID=3398228 RepID=UPI003AB0C2DB